MRCVFIYNAETDQESDHWWGDLADTDRKAREYRARIALGDSADIETVEFAWETHNSCLPGN